MQKDNDYIVQRGSLLMAEPFLGDPNFKRTVILMAEHDDFGSIGFIVNRPSEYMLHEVLPEFPYFESRIYIGGPVDSQALQFIHSDNIAVKGSVEIAEGIFWGRSFEDLRTLIESRAVQPDDIRLFAGYAGWTAGQLRREIDEHSWVCRPATKDDVFTPKAQLQWTREMRKLGEEYALFSLMPEHPSIN